MSDFRSHKLPERNPITYQSHRREVLWQITLPFIFGVLVILALLGLALIFPGGAEGQSRWADISLIWLILPILFLAFILLAVFAGMAYAVMVIGRAIPSFSLKAQHLVDQIGGAVRKASDAAVEPILRAQSISAGWRALRRR